MINLISGQQASTNTGKTVVVFALLGMPTFLFATLRIAGLQKAEVPLRLASEMKDHPWDFAPRNEREEAHLGAADFLVKLNFFEDGHGLVLPPSLTLDRISQGMGTQEFVQLSGLVYDQGELYGISEEKIDSTSVLVAGCAACHVGKAAGIVVPGLGNKTADFFGLVRASEDSVKSAIDLDTVVHACDEQWERANKAGTRSFNRILENLEYDSGVVGGITQFFALESAFEELGLELTKSLYAPVKTPSLWGYGPKRKVGVFTDALLKGFPAGAAGLPLFIGNYNLDLLQQNMDSYEAAEQQFEKLLPPGYPFRVDHDKTGRGKKLFAGHCAACHGDHERDNDGLPLFAQPNFVALEEVATDPVRATVFDQEVGEQFAASQLAPYLERTEIEPGYIAPNLWGIWARFPYLHNGSIANIKDLLTPPHQRPRYIDMRDIGELRRFDEQRLGATPANAADASQRAARRDRWILDTNRKAFGNGGHDFGTDLDQDDKLALIEYLKTL